MKIARNISFLLLISLLFSCAVQKKEVVKDDTIYEVADVPPTFKGGPQALYNFIGSKLVYPPSAEKQGIEGTVVVRFVIDEKGNVVNAHTVRSSGNKVLDNEALRVIKSLPKWNAGKKDGEPVKVYYTLPIRFKLPKPKQYRPNNFV